MRSLALFLLVFLTPLAAQDKFRVGMIGLTHGHASGFLRNFLAHPDLDLVGISEPDKALAAQYATRYKLDPARLFNSHAEMLDKTKPEAVMIFTSTYEHRDLVELCALRKIHVMMEKPLAVSVVHARAMEAAAKRSGIHVLVNYETTWYPVNEPIWRLVHDEKKLGEIRRIVTHYGHQGPKEIGVGPEFFNWLTDPAKNGAGALFDFGCYGANFATWLFDNQRPLSVSAVTRTNKPAIYPRVDDEATIIVQYPKTQLIIQPSWNWPFSRKDMEVYGESGYLITSNPTAYRTRMGNEREDTAHVAPPLPAPLQDVIAYFKAIVRGNNVPAGLPSLHNNVLVTEILDAARQSAATGKTVVLSR